MSHYLMYKDLFDTGLLEKHNNLRCLTIELPIAQPHNWRGYTYILKGYFPGYPKPIKKIGRSGNPGARYQNITEFCPFPVFLDYLFLSPFDLEKELHREFASKRVYNRYCPSGGTEWFMGVDDAEIIAAAINIDRNKPYPRMGEAEIGLLNYSAVFKLDAGQYFGNKINYAEVLNNLDLEEKGAESIPLLLDTAEIIYGEMEKQRVINEALEAAKIFA